MTMRPTEPGEELSSVPSRSHWLQIHVSTPDNVSELLNYRDEHSDPEPASDADETEGKSVRR